MKLRHDIWNGIICISTRTNGRCLWTK